MELTKSEIGDVFIMEKVTCQSPIVSKEARARLGDGNNIATGAECLPTDAFHGDHVHTAISSPFLFT